ncbi:MAG: FAD-binding oxidoreductase [Fimbriimonadales bacterium]
MSLPRARLERVEAWGMSTWSTSYVFRPVDKQGILEAIDEAGRTGLKIALKGGGNSYGDAFQSPEGVVIDLSRMTRILSYDRQTGVIRCEPGVTIEALWEHVIGDGWWPPVVSGTSKVTLGGALAANIHGKNNFHAGPIGEHVRSFRLLKVDGTSVECNQDDDLFYAVIGGFGLLGVITEIELQLKRIHSGKLRVEAFASGNWDETIRIFAEQENHDYLVAWIDGFAQGQCAGRGLIHAADYLDEGEDPHPEETLSVRAQELPDTAMGWIPKSKMHSLMSPFVSRFGMRFTNALKFRSAKKEHGKVILQRFAEFNFLLDSVPNWKFAYKPGALIQYQAFIPKENAQITLADITEYARDRKHPPFLAVMKRHRPDKFLLSHAVDGYSLALDFPVGRRNREDLWALTAELDRLVLAAGGRFYFAKDSTMRQTTADAYLGEAVQRFMDIKRQLDPENLLQTSLSRRIFGDL